MTVFKYYFKIVKKHLPLILMYFVICIAVSIVVSNVNDGSEGDFTESKPAVAVINNDDSQLSETLRDYIKETADIKSLENHREKTIQDAIFEREVDAVIIIPAGFGDALEEGEDPQLKVATVPDSVNARYTEMLYDRFLNVAATFFEAGMTQDEVDAVIADDLKTDTEVKMYDEKQEEFASSTYFYNYSNFGIMSILIYGIGMLSIAFNRRELRMRNLASGYSAGRINREILAANLLLAAVTWLVFVVTSVIMFGSEVLCVSGVIMMLNAFIFTISTLSLAFLIASFVKKKDAVSGMMNVFALGSSFLCGAFIPQQLLGSVTLNISRIFPSYWYINNNNRIELLSSINWESMQPILANMAVMIGFSVLFLLLQSIINRKKRAA